MCQKERERKIGEELDDIEVNHNADTRGGYDRPMAALKTRHLSRCHIL